MKSTVFVSYRRAQSSDITGRICDHLSRHLGDENVFRDVDKIVGGADFQTVIRKEVATRDALLVVIDPQWIDLTGRSGLRRLDDNNDLVRIEIETALERNKLVIPLLVSGAAMPAPETLPDSLKPLTTRNAIPIRSDPDFKNDIARLVRELTTPKSRRPIVAQSLYVVIMGIALGLYASGLAGKILRGLGVSNHTAGLSFEQSLPGQTKKQFELLLQRQFRNELYTGQLSYTVHVESLRIRFAQDVLFRPGERGLHRDGEQLLERLATVLLLSGERPYEQIQIEGHTDDVPVRRDYYPHDNWELSTARATSVLRHLAHRVRNPLDERRMSVVGFAANRPVSERRGFNRRIEIRVYFPDDSTTTEALP